MRWVLVRTRDRGLYNPSLRSREENRTNRNEEPNLVGDAAPMSANSRYDQFEIVGSLSPR